MNTQNGYTVKYKSEYYSYCQMKSRCNNNKHPQFHNYGGRGISVCEKWKNSFVCFVDDMHPKPAKGYSIDRINVNGNYEPANCKWSNNKEQNNNRRDCIFFEYNGIKLTLTQWAEKLSINKQTLHERLKRGYTVTQIIEKPVNKKRIIK